jgi:ArsR family transcriptional regulator
MELHGRVMDDLLSALRAAGEPTRLRLLVLCAHMDLTVSQLVQVLGQSQPRISRHLKLLWEAGLLERHREGSWVFFRLAARGASGELARTLVDALPDDDPVINLDLKRLEGIRRDRERLAAEYFKRVAAKWDEIRSLYVDEALVESKLQEVISAEAIGDLLDIGTGTGRIVKALAPQVEQAVGLDLSHEMLTVARANLERAQLRNCAVRHGDMYQLPMENGSFDVATLHQVLHFAERPAAVIAEASRVLKPKGRLIVVDFAKHELEELRDKHAHNWLGFDDEEINDWCRKAHLKMQPPIVLSGAPLAVVIWQARRPAAPSAARLVGASRS